MTQELPIQLSFNVKDDWSNKGGFTGDISLTNNGESIPKWTVEFDAPFKIKKIWNAEIVSQVGNHYVIKNGRWNGDIDTDETVSFGFSAEVDNKTIIEPTNYIFNQKPLGTASEENEEDIDLTPNNNFIGEIGKITDLNHLGKTIQLQNQYKNPVVFALPLSNQEGDPAIARITDIQSDNFSVYVQEAEYEDGVHAEEELSYMVVEAGTWKLDDGTILQVGNIDTKKTTSSGWETINFSTEFNNTPVVLSQVQTDNDQTFVRTRQQKAKSNGFQLALEEEEKLKKSGHETESVGWFAIETGEGSWNGLNYQAGTTGDKVTHQWHNLDFNNFTKAPNLLAGLGTYDGGDSAGLRYTDLGSNGVKISIEEDTSLDRETNHTDEVVNFLAIEGFSNLTGIAFNEENNDDDDTVTPPPAPKPKPTPAPKLSPQAIAVGFENHKVNTEYDRPVQEKDWKVDWVDTKLMNDSAFISNKEAHSGNQSLEISYSPNKRTGAGAAWDIPEKREYYFQYSVKFEDGFDFDGSKQSGGKLPGLAGAGGHCSGGQTCNGNNGFSSRYMWGKKGRAKAYVYHMKKPTKWGENFWFEDSDGEDVFFEPGKWHTLTQRVKINDGNKPNGSMDVWMDGEQVLDIDGLQFVSNNKGIDSVMFSTFYGGNSQDFLPGQETKAYFDDLIVSTNASDVGL